MQSTFTKLFAILGIIGLVILSSCNKDEISDPVEIINTEAHIVNYSSNSEYLFIHIDALLDTSNQLDWSQNSFTDFYTIYFDANNNEALDPNLDFLIGRSSAGVCFAHLLTESSTTGCDFQTGTAAQNIFGPSNNAAYDHVQFEIEVPLSLFESSNETKIFINMNDASGVSHSYPGFGGREKESFFNPAYSVEF